jgi:hypothetical protein
VSVALPQGLGVTEGVRVLLGDCEPHTVLVHDCAYECAGLRVREGEPVEEREAELQALAERLKLEVPQREGVGVPEGLPVGAAGLGVAPQDCASAWLPARVALRARVGEPAPLGAPPIALCGGTVECVVEREREGGKGEVETLALGGTGAPKVRQRGGLLLAQGKGTSAEALAEGLAAAAGCVALPGVVAEGVAVRVEEPMGQREVKKGRLGVAE